ncbi:DUF6356 family protein [Fangia hongkongensis]|uniref:DUF6356 family protein n=1 Tax=Fangia hongkongensis TaxID=270495 RepID=UPI00037A39D0|nr:DUF6356 family protein [Fangia hongkongensis]MBK2124065.1 hypothetical protein [Fangia hongkongensis]
MHFFSKHLHEVNESYFQHLKEAAYCGGLMIIAGIACTIHAIFPFLLQKTASKILQKLQTRFTKRNRLDEV